MLEQSKYLFHVHTNLTDGELSVQDYFRFACEHGFLTIVFLEHISRQPTYDVAKFAAEIKRHAAACGVAGAVGFEAKLLPDGELDIPRAPLEVAEYVGIAEHAFPGNPRELERAFCMALDHYILCYSGIRFVWVHPGLWFQRHGCLSHPAYARMLASCVQYPIWIERSLRYGLPVGPPRTHLSARFITGVDAHTRADLTLALEAL